MRKMYRAYKLTKRLLFEFAKALNYEIPDIDKIAKMICVMDDSLVVKIGVN